MKSSDVENALLKVANKKKAKDLARFFKTSKGEYGFGDVFIGVTVPEQRKIVKEFSDLAISEIQKLLKSKIHEHRLTALLILVGQFEKGDEKVRKVLVGLYLKNTKHINNWDLVDLSAPRVVGGFFYAKQKQVLYRLAKSRNLWERRIAILSTFYFITKNDFADSIKIARILFSDEQDLIHKAGGWMLREVGKRDKKILTEFLDKYAITMPRTTLRYAIEKFPETIRQKYLNKI